MKYIHKDKPVVLMKYTFLNPKTNSLTHFQNISFQKFGTSICLMSKTQKTLKMFAKQVKSYIVKSYSSNVNGANPYCHHCTGS